MQRLKQQLKQVTIMKYDIFEPFIVDLQSSMQQSKLNIHKIFRYTYNIDIKKKKTSIKKKR